MSSGTYSISKKDFHSYIDSQLTDAQYETIEKRLDESPHIIRELQNCLLINERIQSCFSEVDDAEIDVEFADMGDTIISLENVETNQAEPEELDEKFYRYLEPPEDDTSQILNNGDSPPSPDEAAMDAILIDKSPELELVPSNTILPPRIPELTGEAKPSGTDLAPKKKTPVPPILTDSPYPPKKKIESPITESEDIDVDNFLKGINETHMVDHAHQLTRQSLRKNIFSTFSATSALSNLIKIFLARTKNGIRRKIYANSNQRASTAGSSIEDTITQSNTNIEYPVLSNNEHAASIKGELQPFEFSAPTGLSRVNSFLNAISKVSFVAKALKQKYWILASMFVGLLIGNMLFSETADTGHNELESLAIDTHLYYVAQGLNAVEAGEDDFEANMQWLEHYWGKRVNTFEISESTKFRRKGSILIPSLYGYVSVQTFQNSNNEQLTLFVSRVDDASKDSRIRCHNTEKVDGLCSWSKDSLAYFVIGDITLSRVRLFSTVIASQT